MKIIQWTSINCIFLFVGVLHLSDARLDFWNDSKGDRKNVDSEKHVHDLNPNKLSPVIFSK